MNNRSPARKDFAFRLDDQSGVPVYRQLIDQVMGGMAAGALAEIGALAERKLDPELPAMKAHGVPWLSRHLNGEIALVDAAEGTKRDTRRYTKRQATWFRNRLSDFAWAEPKQARAAIEAQLRALAK